MATLDSSESVYNAARRRLTCTYVVDGVSHTKVFRNSPNDSGHHATILADHGVKLVARIERQAADDTSEQVKGAGSWDTMLEATQEEQDAKQLAAQVMVREASEFARKGLQLQGEPRTRQEATTQFFEARQLLHKIIPNLTGTAAAKRTYLNLTPDEWSSIRDFHDDIQTNSATFTTFITYMAAAPDVVRIKSEASV